MLSAITTKISMYLKIGLLVVIIGLLVFVGIQYVRIKSLEKTNHELEIKNEVLIKDNMFFNSRLKILSDFSNSQNIINTITNEIVFDSDKQKAIDSILEDFRK